MQPRTNLNDHYFSDDTYTIAPRKKPAAPPAEEPWLTEATEGQLSIDVSETPEAFLITAPIAGVRPNDLEIFVSRDLITIRGKREAQSHITEQTFLYKECYWGQFSRSIMLPAAVQPEAAEAVLRHGVLSIRLPKQADSLYIPIS
ncbi:MAG: Hsp20/alpha crystallin family protein, partial [bacterium]|nr:Hsp20/alpha crystallin family protein [bacterium]